MNKNTLFTKEYNILLASSFLFFISFNLVIAELPAYLDSIGGESYKGLIIALFTLTAGLSRPFSGKLADEFSRKKAILIGAIVCFIVSAMYPLSQAIWFFLLLRLLHGISTGFNPTGVSAYMADILPFNRRGEAMGYLGFFCSTGMAIGPMIGSYTAGVYGINTMFHLATFLSFVTVLFSLLIPENKEKNKKSIWTILKVTKDDFWEKRVLPVAIIMLLAELNFGIILTIIPDYTETLGLTNKSIFFSTFVISSVFVRIFMGKLSDRVGRIPVLKIALLVCVLAMLILGFGNSVFSFILSAIVLGLGLGTVGPTLFAWTIDLSDPKKIGKGFATLYISLEIGIGIGAFISGTFLPYTNYNFNLMFFFGCFAFIASFFYLIYYQKSDNKNSN